MCRVAASRLFAIGSGCFLDTNEQIEHIFDKWLSLWAQLNKIESRKFRRSELPASRVGGCNVCSKARSVAATYGAGLMMVDKQLARSVAD